MNILTLSIGRHILREGSIDRKRMRLYAVHLDALHIIVLTRYEHGFTDTIHEGSLHIYPTNSSSRFAMLVDAFHIGRSILKQSTIQPLTISAQDPFEIGFVSYLLAKVGRAHFHVQLHGDYFDSLWRGNSFMRRGRLFLARLLLARAQGIRVVSERIKKSLIRRHIAESKITVLPIRPELEMFLGVEHKPREGATPLIFLTVSRLAPEKNITLMLSAFARFAEKYPHAELRIVGSGEEEQKIRDFILKHSLDKNVTMIPWTDNVPSEMAKADIFLLASDHEAYGLVLVEALTAGLPVVTTDVGCVGEVVLNGIHSIVVPPRNETLYFEALEAIAVDSDRRKKMSAAGKDVGKKLLHMSETEYAQTWVAAHSCSTGKV